MYYKLISEIVELIAVYEQQSTTKSEDVALFIQWLNHTAKDHGYDRPPDPNWNGKSNGRSADSVINTSLVHLYRYAKTLAKDAIADSELSTPDDFFYLITLASQGPMSKTALIKCNVHEKSSGIQIINRLHEQGFVNQEQTQKDKRERMVSITEKGKQIINEHMPRIKTASTIVTEPLSNEEKMDLIRLLTKLEDFHQARSTSSL